MVPSRTFSDSPLAADRPMVVVFDLQRQEAYLEIRTAHTHDLVAVLELISPENKSSGHGRAEYRAGQDRALASQAHLVEIDLLRQGATPAYLPPGSLRALEPFDYLACVNRADKRGGSEVYPFNVRQRFPRIDIPLRAPDADGVLDLSAAFNDCYRDGAYHLQVDYRNPPAHPLRREDEEWADTLLREAGVRE